MPRPKEEKPTAGELEVLKVLWDRGPSTVREVMDVLNERRERAYTSVMSLLNTMFEKGFLRRKPEGRAFVYSPRVTREKTLGRMVHDLVTQWHGSISAEHGIGQLKRDELARLSDPVALALMRRVKAALDPQGLLNPGKLV